jgi:hypothetical protein
MDSTSLRSAQSCLCVLSRCHLHHQKSLLCPLKIIFIVLMRLVMKFEEDKESEMEEVDDQCFLSKCFRAPRYNFDLFIRNQ